MRSGHEDKAAPRMRRRETATASPTSTPCKLPRRARDAPRGETCDDRGLVHHPEEDPRSSPPPPYYDGGIRAPP